jgi:hypothetical protein
MLNLNQSTAMKLKIFYILLIICCMSLFSSARPNDTEADRKCCCRISKTVCIKTSPLKTVKADVDLPPLRLLMFDL